jgi:3-hydroxyisobutyrate dehydrogenase-like beta-hydroxyacid dehydrogenase
MGNKIVHAGGHGTGTSVKMVINLLLGTGMAAFAEAMALGKGLGLSSKMLFRFLARHARGRTVSRNETAEDRERKLRS